MANAIYDKYKEALISADSNVSLATGSVQVSLVDTADTTFSSAHEFYDDLVNSANGVIATANLDNVTVTNGVLDGDDVVFESLSGDSAEALLIWIDTGNTATDRLVAWMDTDVDGLPITPDSSNVTITWSTSGIFKL